jgi:hypothetical protein
MRTVSARREKLSIYLAKTSAYNAPEKIVNIEKAKPPEQIIVPELEATLYVKIEPTNNGQSSLRTINLFLKDFLAGANPSALLF